MEANNSRTAVSVIVPIYQSENYLRECLDSLVSQDFDLPYEIILSVFGSSDESLAICEEYEQKYPEKIFIVLGEKNYGISASRNAGIVKSRGDYLTFVDSDDALARNFLSVLYKLAKKGDYDIVTSGFYMYGPVKVFNTHRGSYKGDGVKLLKKFFFSPRLCYQVYCWGRLYKRELLMDNKIRFPSEMPIYEDWPFFIEAFLNASKVAFTRKQLYHYIQRPNSATHKIRDSVYYNLKALALARRLMLSRNPALALKVFRKPSYPIRMHLLWDSHVCHKLYHLSLMKVYSQSKKRLADVYAGKEIQDGPKTL
jgi:glycosyltransferase involved in cell wall biosynthesis